MTQPIIRVQNLSKQYRIGTARQGYVTLRESLMNLFAAPFRRMAQGRGSLPTDEIHWALKNVSFDVQPGEVVGVIGRNGAGKSTLLKVLSHITEPSEGRVEIHGQVASLLEVGTGFHAELSGRENIFLNGAILGMARREIQRKFDEIVAFAEVERFIDTPVKRYSSGMYLRLAFSVAAHLEPDILVVDEVLAVGDDSFQKKCMGKMEDVAHQGRTVLFVSHNMPAVARMCSRAILLSSGSLLEDGPAADVIGTYLKGVVEDTGLKTWDEATAPGNEDIRLLEVALLDDAQTPRTVVSVADELQIRLTYHVLTPGLTFRSGIGLYTQGVCAFGSVEPAETAKEREGVYHSTVTVPAHLLTEGEYTLGVTLVSSRGFRSRLAAVKDVMAFLVKDPVTGDTARGNYTERIAGVVRPKLSWQLRYEDETLPPIAAERPLALVETNEAEEFALVNGRGSRRAGQPEEVEP